MKKISGTKEWATHNCNFITGCENNCRYCYARWNAVDRFKLVESEEAWKTMVVREKDVNKKRGKKTGTIMIPTTHDIVPSVLPSALIVLSKLIGAGNDVLIVSKPHLQCIKEICTAFLDFRKQILFRFTIGAMDDTLLKYWEPGAPSFKERLQSLKYAYDAGYATSVSMEPLLDAKNVVSIFDKLKPYVTNSIWIGKLNKVDKRVKIVTEEDRKQVAKIMEGQTDDIIRIIYQCLKREPLVKWKESYKEVLGLKLAEEEGRDE